MSVHPPRWVSPLRTQGNKLESPKKISSTISTSKDAHNIISPIPQNLNPNFTLENIENESILKRTLKPSLTLSELETPLEHAGTPELEAAAFLSGQTFSRHMHSLNSSIKPKVKSKNVPSFPYEQPSNEQTFNGSTSTYSKELNNYNTPSSPSLANLSFGETNQPKYDQPFNSNSSFSPNKPNLQEKLPQQTGITNTNRNFFYEHSDSNNLAHNTKDPNKHSQDYTLDHKIGSFQPKQTLPIYKHTRPNYNQLLPSHYPNDKTPSKPYYNAQPKGLNLDLTVNYPSDYAPPISPHFESPSFDSYIYSPKHEKVQSESHDRSNHTDTYFFTNLGTTYTNNESPSDNYNALHHSFSPSYNISDNGSYKNSVCVTNDTCQQSIVNPTGNIASPFPTTSSLNYNNSTSTIYNQSSNFKKTSKHYDSKYTSSFENIANSINVNRNQTQHHQHLLKQSHHPLCDNMISISTPENKSSLMTVSKFTTSVQTFPDKTTIESNIPMRHSEPNMFLITSNTTMEIPYPFLIETHKSFPSNDQFPALYKPPKTDDRNITTEFHTNFTQNDPFETNDSSASSKAIDFNLNKTDIQGETNSTHNEPSNHSLHITHQPESLPQPYNYQSILSPNQTLYPPPQPKETYTKIPHDLLIQQPHTRQLLSTSSPNDTMSTNYKYKTLSVPQPNYTNHISEASTNQLQTSYDHTPIAMDDDIYLSLSNRKFNNLNNEGQKKSEYQNREHQFNDSEIYHFFNIHKQSNFSPETSYPILENSNYFSSPFPLANKPINIDKKKLFHIDNDTVKESSTYSIEDNVEHSQNAEGSSILPPPITETSETKQNAFPSPSSNSQRHINEKREEPVHNDNVYVENNLNFSALYEKYVNLKESNPTAFQDSSSSILLSNNNKYINSSSNTESNASFLDQHQLQEPSNDQFHNSIMKTPYKLENIAQRIEKAEIDIASSYNYDATNPRPLINQKQNCNKETNKKIDNIKAKESENPMTYNVSKSINSQVNSLSSINEGAYNFLSNYSSSNNTHSHALYAKPLLTHTSQSQHLQQDVPSQKNSKHIQHLLQNFPDANPQPNTTHNPPQINSNISSVPIININNHKSHHKHAISSKRYDSPLYIHNYVARPSLENQGQLQELTDICSLNQTTDFRLPPNTEGESMEEIPHIQHTLQTLSTGSHNIAFHIPSKSNKIPFQDNLKDNNQGTTYAKVATENAPHTIQISTTQNHIINKGALLNDNHTCHSFQHQNTMPPAASEKSSSTTSYDPSKNISLYESIIESIGTTNIQVEKAKEIFDVSFSKKSDVGNISSEPKNIFADTNYETAIINSQASTYAYTAQNEQYTLEKPLEISPDDETEANASTCTPLSLNPSIATLIKSPANQSSYHHPFTNHTFTKEKKLHTRKIDCIGPIPSYTDWERLNTYLSLSGHSTIQITPNNVSTNQPLSINFGHLLDLIYSMKEEIDERREKLLSTRYDSKNIANLECSNEKLIEENDNMKRKIESLVNDKKQFTQSKTQVDEILASNNILRARNQKLKIDLNDTLIISKQLYTTLDEKDKEIEQLKTEIETYQKEKKTFYNPKNNLPPNHIEINELLKEYENQLYFYKTTCKHLEEAIVNIENPIRSEDDYSEPCLNPSETDETIASNFGTSHMSPHEAHNQVPAKYTGVQKFKSRSTLTYDSATQTCSYDLENWLIKTLSLPSIETCMESLPRIKYHSDLLEEFTTEILKLFTMKSSEQPLSDSVPLLISKIEKLILENQLASEKNSDYEILLESLKNRLATNSISDILPRLNHLLGLIDHFKEHNYIIRALKKLLNTDHVEEILPRLGRTLRFLKNHSSVK